MQLVTGVGFSRTPLGSCTVRVILKRRFFGGKDVEDSGPPYTDAIFYWNFIFIHLLFIHSVPEFDPAT